MKTSKRTFWFFGLFFCLGILSGCCGDIQWPWCPEEEEIENGEPESEVSYNDLAVRYSPIIVQDIGGTKYGDYITRIDYDGDYIGNNNWDNLGYPTKARPLPAYVYYAVMETETHYFIWYALFHPADDFHIHYARHENDLEGMVMCVRKDGSLYGQLRLVQLQAHNDFKQYKAPGVTVVYDDEDDIDGTIELQFFNGVLHPRVYVEGGGHGIEHEDTGSWPSVIYRYTGTAQDPDDIAPDTVPDRVVGYDLLSIFTEMWERRTDCCGPGHLFDDWGNYEGRRFTIQGLGRRFDGDNYEGPMQGPDEANPPWNWDDDDDGQWNKGDWFMDPADYHTRLRWEEPFSTNYTFHPFGYEQ